ncbi:MAG: hypothetical protein IKV94_05170 [Clostridia bacterium]|nr:hypothetical protein [Clostridia bacterium]
MNPFEQKPIDLEKAYMNWKEIYPKAYDKNNVDPYTKTRIILMNGAETEQVFFLHQFNRNCDNNDVRRQLAVIRRTSQQMQKLIQCLKPINENVLEETITYEMLAVDLTARLAKDEPDPYVKQALDFALLEDFDHLYRYSNLLQMEYGVPAEKLVGRYTEIMPARPTISHHRCPLDSIKFHVNNKQVDLLTKLHINIITAAEQQTMNFYMNICNLYPSDLGRRLYQEIGMVEEQHVTHYGSLMDTNVGWYENLLMHMYTMCYLYYSCMMDETNMYIKKVWKAGFERSVAGLHLAAYLLRQYDNKEVTDVIPNPIFPKLLTLGPNVEYVRDILKCTVDYTALREGYIPVQNLEPNAGFFKYQGQVNEYVECVPSHNTIEKYIALHGCDYRFEVAPNPIPELRNRKEDNTTVGRTWGCHRYVKKNLEKEEES